MEKEQLNRLIEVAAGRRPADLVLRGAQIVDVFQGTTFAGDIAIADGLIAGVGESYEGLEVHDLTGYTITPGLIEPHMHIESAYVTPEEFGRLLAIRGTTTALVDPHEIVNVKGLAGLDYMAAAAQKTAIDIRFMMPSCVPATELEHSGARVAAEDMRSYLEAGTVDGLAEFMDFSGVIKHTDRAIDKILLAKAFNKRIDGHCPGLAGKELNAYAAAGIDNDHECSTVEEMQARLRLGMYVFLREGTAAHNLRQLIPGITPCNSRRCVLCGDDVQAKTLLEAGHLDHCIRICVAEGMDAVTAIQMATLNAAESCGLNDRGAIAPGRRADFILFDNLSDLNVQSTYVEGAVVAEKGRYLLPIEKVADSAMRHTVHLTNFSKERLALPLKTDQARIIEIIPNELLTNELVLTVKRDAASDFVYDPAQPITKVAVIERHGGNGNVAVALLKDYGLDQGAIALTIGHDAHNIIVTGTDDEDMYQAVLALEKLGGGAVLVAEGVVKADFPLPIAGLMSDASGEEVTKQQTHFNEVAFNEFGISADIDPIMTLSFIPLSVIPHLKLTDMGLVDVMKSEIVSIDVD